MYEIYAYWNAENLRAVYNAVAMIMNGGDFLGLMKALAIGALLVSVGTAMVRMKGEEPIAYLVVFALFYGTLFVPRSNVSIVDVRTSQVFPVANVPLGLAFFGSTTSHIGKWLTEQYETFVTPVDDEKFSHTGMAFGARIVHELQHVKIQNTGLKRDMSLFVRNCVNPEFIDRPDLMHEFQNKANIWSYVGGGGGDGGGGGGGSGFSLNPGRATIVGQNAVNCVDAYAALSNALEVEATRRGADLGRRLNPNDPAADIAVMSQIPNMEAAMLNVSRTAIDSLRQGMVANLMIENVGLSSMPSSDDFQVAWAVAQAEQTSRVSYAAMARIAESTLPKLRNGIEILITVLFPVILLLIVLAGVKGMLVLKAYLMGMFWIQLWAPLYAVINFMTTQSDAKDFKASLLGSSTDGPTLSTMGRLSELALSNQAIAGLLTVSVPLIAYALVKGGEMGMSSVASKVMDPSSQAAGKAGEAAGLGNSNVGNVSWGNTSMNNWSGGNWSGGNTSMNNASGNSYDMSQKSTDPWMNTNKGAHGTVTTDRQNNVTGAHMTGYNVGGAANGSMDMSRSNTASSAASVRAGQNWSKALEQSNTATSSQNSAATFMRSLSTAVANSTGVDTSTGKSNEVSAGTTSGTRIGGSTALSNQEAARFGSDLGAGGSATMSNTIGGDGGGGKDSGKGGSGVKGRLASQISPSIGLGASNTQALMDQAFKGSETGSNKGQREAIQTLQTAAKKVSESTTDQGVRAAAQNFMSDLQNATRSSSTTSGQLTKEQSAGEQRQQGTTGSSGVTMQDGKSVFDAAVAKHGGDVGAALQALNNGSFAEKSDIARDAGANNKGEAQGWLNQGGAAPRSMASVESAGRGIVAASGGGGAVQAAHAANSAAVGAQQQFSPQSGPNTQDVKSMHGAAGALHNLDAKGLQQDAKLEGGVASAASAIYSSDQKGMGTVMANALAFGAGYKNTEEVAQHLNFAASQDAGLRSTLQSYNGQAMSKDMQEYISGVLRDNPMPKK